MSNLTHEKRIKIIDKLSKHPMVFGTVFCISEDKKTDFSYATGNMKTETPYYIASINKFFISALTLELIQKGKLSFDSKISSFLTEEEVSGIHIFNGTDYSHQITIEHLLSHRSGLPGYLIDKQADGRVAMKELENGTDQLWDIHKVINAIKFMKPNFPPGTPKKAKYIDTNHHLLSLILERVSGKSFRELLQDVLDDLEMTNTHVYGREKLTFAPVYFKKEQRNITQFMSSTGIDIVSTAKDLMKFLKAFFAGYFYPKHKLIELEKWNQIFFPFHYGIGIQKFQIPKILTLFQHVPNMIGHSGSTGSVAFYIPEREMFITGTINQQAAPRLIFQTMIKLIRA